MVRQCHNIVQLVISCKLVTLFRCITIDVRCVVLLLRITKFETMFKGVGSKGSKIWERNLQVGSKGSKIWWWSHQVGSDAHPFHKNLVSKMIRFKNDSCQKTSFHKKLHFKNVSFQKHSHFWTFVSKTIVSKTSFFDTMFSRNDSKVLSVPPSLQEPKTFKVRVDTTT